MSEPFLAEIRIFGFNFPPRGFAQCDGQILPISQNQALFSLLGTTYGGDGRTTFALPELRGRTPLHRGMAPGGASDHRLGEKSGTEGVTLSTAQLPAHTHTARASTATADSPTPVPSTTGKNTLARSVHEIYRDPVALAPMRDGTLSNAGSSQAHENMQPYLAINFCIARTGLFPSRN